MSHKQVAILIWVNLRNEFDFWKVHGIMNTSGLLQSKLSPSGFTLTLQELTLQETPYIHDSKNLQKIETIAYIYIFLLITNTCI